MAGSAGLLHWTICRHRRSTSAVNMDGDALSRAYVAYGVQSEQLELHKLNLCEWARAGNIFYCKKFDLHTYSRIVSRSVSRCATVK